MIPDAYRHARAESGKLKLRATALLAEGGSDERFEAACLLHHAARAEARALRILDAPLPSVRVTSAIERCACLVEGFDPPGAALAWGEVLDALRWAPDTAAAAARDPIDVKRRVQARAWSRAIAASPAYARAVSGAVWIPTMRDPRERLLPELKALLERFPGVAELWLVLAANEEAEGDFAAAWLSVEQARRLDPEGPQAWAMSLSIAAQALGQADADAQLVQVHAAVESAPWDVCLMAAAVELLMARRWGGERDRWERALRATVEGESRRDAPRLFRKYFRALHLLLAERLAGRKPTEEILYRAGLGDRMVGAAPTPRRTIEDVLIRQIQQSVGARAEAA